ncbi:unnamed protein product [Caretta caretta]
MLLKLVLEIPSFKPFQDQRMFVGWTELGGFFKAVFSARSTKGLQLRSRPRGAGCCTDIWCGIETHPRK